eukprot:gene19132-21049_t
MANTEVLFCIIIVVVILVKMLFWCLYLCTKSQRIRSVRRREEARQQASEQMCYEEVPAIPQPAFVFTGLSMTLPNTSLAESLPAYQTEDPYKIENPPPSYIDICNSTLTSQELQAFSNIAECSSDRQRLIADDDQLRACLDQA